MTMQVVALADLRPQPWRNGGGVTRELLTWPAAQAWGIRVSVADIERDGPFSAFPGVERWFAVLDGAGVELAFEDTGEQHAIAPGDAPWRFDGGRAVHCALRAGATRDLNVMAATKRGRATCTIARPGEARRGRRDLRALFAQDATRLAHREHTLALPASAFAWSAHVDGEWRVLDDARAFWIEFVASGR